jgi:LysR family hydrogen peroxide-inducible transcriptional activator
MNFTFKQLRYALAVADTGHFGRAAELCAVSQPALSQPIHLLEAACGSPLFERLKGGAELTPFGKDFLERAEDVMRSANALDSFVSGYRGAPNRAIRFGLIPTVAPYLLPEIFPRLTAQLPDLQFAISENRTEALLSGVSDGSLDIALIATEPPPGGTKLTVETLFDDPFVLATPRGEDTTNPVSLATLQPDRILLLDEGHCFRDQTIAACRLEGQRGTKTFAATSLSTIVEFVANGQGVTLLPSIALRKEASDERIAIHKLDSSVAARQLRLVWRASTPFGESFARITETIRQVRDTD